MEYDFRHSSKELRNIAQDCQEFDDSCSYKYNFTKVDDLINQKMLFAAKQGYTWTTITINDYEISLFKKTVIEEILRILNCYYTVEYEFLENQNHEFTISW